MYGYSPLKAYVRLYLKGLRGWAEFSLSVSDSMPQSVYCGEFSGM